MSAISLPCSVRLARVPETCLSGHESAESKEDGEEGRGEMHYERF